MKFWKRDRQPSHEGEFVITMPDRPAHPLVEELEDIAGKLQGTVTHRRGQAVSNAFDFIGADEPSITYTGLVRALAAQEILPGPIGAAASWIDGFMIGALWARGDVDDLTTQTAVDQLNMFLDNEYEKRGWDEHGA